MTEDLETLDKLVDSMTSAEIDKINQDGIELVKEEYNEFSSGFAKNICYLCGYSITSLDDNTPCLHWLLMPKGFRKKKHFKMIYKKFSFFQIDSYLRFVANFETPFGNINDLEEEKSEEKLIETTITYKNFVWSFSCSPGDIEGHKNSSNGNFPHYHFQMMVDGKPFITFSDFHVPFKKSDIMNLKVISGGAKNIKHMRLYDAGMNDIMTHIKNDPTILDMMRTGSSDQKRVFNLTSMIEAKPGKTLSGNDIADLIEENKKTGVPMAKLSERLDANKTVIISPGDDVPEILKRSKRR